MTGLDRLRAHRRSIAVVATVALVLVVLSVLTVVSTTRGGDLDPDNPRGNGAQAVARVLARHGIDVTVVRRAATLESTDVDADTTVLVTSTGELGRATTRAVSMGTMRATPSSVAFCTSQLMRSPLRIAWARVIEHGDSRAG